jgi:hypothetical protein
MTKPSPAVAKKIEDDRFENHEPFPKPGVRGQASTVNKLRIHIAGNRSAALQHYR